MSYPQYTNEVGGVFTLDQLNFNTHFTAMGIDLHIPADIVNEKLIEVGFEILGPKKNRQPAVFRTLEPKIFLEHLPGVRIWLAVSHIQGLVRRAGDGQCEFDIYPVKNGGWK